ncbi:MAG: metal-dependent hydrolase [Lachnospiraceae bacterium]|nr:metal-dependent hydrolase [Lachnospiraceae bacterium]
MTGKTHLAVGTAAALCLLQPDTLKEWVLCLGAASIGSVISDIDASSSDSREELNKITALSVLAMTAVCFAEYRWNLGILKSFDRESSLFRLFTGFVMLLAICSFGKNQPHRTFMHSLPGCLIVTAVVSLIYPDAAPYFLVSMLSHIAIDLLNRRGVQLLYPLKWKLCLDICRSNGIINRWLAHAGAVVSIAASTILLLHI